VNHRRNAAGWEVGYPKYFIRNLTKGNNEKYLVFERTCSAKEGYQFICECDDEIAKDMVLEALELRAKKELADAETERIKK
jgi:hypothetical protein